MKKVFSILTIAALMILTLTACGEGDTSSLSDDSSSSESAGPSFTSQVPLDTLMVGTQEMSGDFISGFGNNAYDLSAKVLLNGYMTTYEIDAAGDIVLNTVAIKDVATDTDSDGNKRYTFTLHDDIFWNNGDPITANDYVAAALWYSSPQWTEAGASSVGVDGLVGYTAFKAGETDVFSGVSLISDTQFSMTIAAENLPYFWEAVHVMVSPIHFDTYLQNAELQSDENGTSIIFSEGDLLTNCTRIAEGERYAPTVSCGPYSFVSYENQTLTLELNEYFKGDLYGNKPEFKNVVQKAIPIETDVEWVISGQVDIVEGVVQGEKIEAVKASDSAIYNTYLRSGYGYLAMMCDFGPTADVNVRWALASLIDRNAVVEYVLSGYGNTVDAEYGIGQWMFAEAGADLQAEMSPISFNIDVANDYLDETEWVYEADGTTAFDRTKASEDGSYIRHNAAGEPLSINHLGQDNVLTDIIEIQYSANAPLAGIDFNLDKGEWSAVLLNYYDAYKLTADDRIYDTFNLATNFSSVFDRYYTWHSDFLGTSINKPQLSDETLDELIIEMRSTDPDDKEGYLDAWIAYQIRFNELMPQVPLYSNEYYDMAHIFVDNFETTAFAGYENIICQLSKSEK